MNYIRYICGAFRNESKIMYFQECLEYYDIAFVITTQKLCYWFSPKAANSAVCTSLVRLGVQSELPGNNSLFPLAPTWTQTRASHTGLWKKTMLLHFSYQPWFLCKWNDLQRLFSDRTVLPEEAMQGFSGKCTDSRIQQIWHLLAVWLYRSHFASPWLSFFMCKRGIITRPSQGWTNVKYVLMAGTVPGSQEELINFLPHCWERGVPSVLFLQNHFPLFIIKYGAELKRTGVNNKYARRKRKEINRRPSWPGKGKE